MFLNNEADGEAKPLFDRSGRLVQPKAFIHFLKENCSMPTGPYRYEGYRHGGHVFSVPGIDFSSREFCSENIELFPWKRWRRPLEHQRRVIGYWEQRRPAKVAENLGK